MVTQLAKVVVKRDGLKEAKKAYNAAVKADDKAWKLRSNLESRMDKMIENTRFKGDMTPTQATRYHGLNKLHTKADKNARALGIKRETATKNYYDWAGIK